MKKRFVFAIIMIVVLSMLAACSFGERSIVGEWYNEKGDCLKIKEDEKWTKNGNNDFGSWEKYNDGSYGIWDILGGGGKTNIQQDPKGRDYIQFKGYIWYRDAYPSDAVKPTSTPYAWYEQYIVTPTSEPMVTPDPITIDPFKGIKYDVSGISPFCTVSINNQDCSAEAQYYVEYTVEGQYFANGDTVTIHAKSPYALTKTEDTFRIENAPYYVESLDGLDCSLLISELRDNVIAETSFETKSSICGVSVENFFIGINLSSYQFNAYYTEIASLEERGAYLLCLKKSLWQDKGDRVINALKILFSCQVKASGTSFGTRRETDFEPMYLSFELYNIVCYPDGHLGFGRNDPERHDIATGGSVVSYEALKASYVDGHRSEYNVTEINNIKWLE